MTSIAVKRLIAGIAGLTYGVVFGSWTLLGTRGWHGNVIWFFLFLFAGLLGLYFPLMAVLAVDLRSRIVKAIFGSLIGFNLVITTVMISAWVTETGGYTPPHDFSITVQANGIGVVLICAAAHFLPTLIFFGSSAPDEDTPISLNNPKCL